jgi:hypothetical protein
MAELNETNKEVELEPNHTHFILVDDGTSGDFGGEMNLRSDLEFELSKGKKLAYYQNPSKASRHGSCSTVDLFRTFNQLPNTDQPEPYNNITIPMILIVVQGGATTLKTVYDSVKKNVPVLVLAVNPFIVLHFSKAHLRFNIRIAFKDSKGCADLISNAINLVNHS